MDSKGSRQEVNSITSQNINTRDPLMINPHMFPSVAYPSTLHCKPITCITGTCNALTYSLSLVCKVCTDLAVAK